MFSVQMNIAIAEAQSSIKSDGTLIEKIKAAMLVTHNHWMCTNEDEQFRAAIGAVMLHYGKGSDEFIQLETEMKSLNKVSAVIHAAQAGLSVNFDSILNAEDNEYKPIGLLKLWQEIK